MISIDGDVMCDDDSQGLGNFRLFSFSGDSPKILSPFYYKRERVVVRRRKQTWRTHETAEVGLRKRKGNIRNIRNITTLLHVQV